MIAKIINFIIVYLLTILNFFVILMPITFFLIFGFFLNNPEVNHYIYSITYLSVGFISALMILILFFNLLFNRSVSFYVKSCTKINSEHFLFKTCEEIKNKFNKQNVVFLVQNSKTINAYAVGGFTKNAIVITSGIIKKYKDEIDGDEELVLALKGILGHEMSHIINKDFLPGLLLSINESANNFVSRILYIFFNILTKLVGILPVVGLTLNNMIVSFYNALDKLISFFYDKILIKIYYFIQLQISKNIEYRADKQGGMTCGGKNMSFALSLLGNTGFFTLFSTHPSTARRMSKVKGVKESTATINAVPFVNLILLFSFVFLIIISFYSIQKANVPELIKDYNSLCVAISNLVAQVKNVIFGFMYKFGLGDIANTIGNIF